jgi:hypothetical protein
MMLYAIPLPFADSGFNYARWELILLSKKQKEMGTLKTTCNYKKTYALRDEKMPSFLKGRNLY